MTGAASRRRGADAERRVVHWLRHNGHPDARRTLAGDGRQPGDISALPGVLVEVKDRTGSSWPAWCRDAQCTAERSGLAAVVVVRRIRGVPDVASWPARHTDDHRRPVDEWTRSTFAAALDALR